MTRYAKVFVIFNDENYLLRTTYENNTKNITIYVKNVNQMSNEVFELIYDYTNAIKNHEISMFHSSRSHRIVDLLYSISHPTHVFYNPNILMDIDHQPNQQQNHQPNQQNHQQDRHQNHQPIQQNRPQNQQLINDLVLDLPELEPALEEIKEAADILITMLDDEKHVLNEITIKNLVVCIKNLKNQGRIFPPDMTNTSRKGLKKIKNFIHNITKVWLNYEEIKQFCRLYLE